MSDDNKRQLVFKLVVLGDPAVGKTSLINQYVQHTFENDYKPSIGVNIIIKELDIEDMNAKIRLILWDIAGQDKYDLSRKMFFQGCIGALLVYDITRPSTYINIESKWLYDLRKFGKKNVVYLLIGNKNDLTNLKHVSTEEGRKLAADLNATEFIETSAKFGDNVEDSFEKLVKQIISQNKIKG